MLVGIDLEDDGLAGHVLCGARDLGGGGAAGAAPVGPEVDEDGDARALDDLVEERGVDLQGLVERGKGVFAGAASAGVGEVICGDAVFLATAVAGSDRRHWVAPANLELLTRD